MLLRSNQDIDREISMSFRYLRDPLFLVCFTVYVVHRILARCGMSTPLLRAHLNDVICIPFWIPIMLWVQRRVGGRSHDGPPESHEVVIPLILWAIMFEVVLPQTHLFSSLAVADPWDVLCYASGAFVAVCFWKWSYGIREPDPLRG
jgi:hypothetical protein